MPKVTVHSFEIFDKEQGIFKKAEGMAPKNTIDGLGIETRILSESVEVDMTELTQSSRYYEAGNEG